MTDTPSSFGTGGSEDNLWSVGGTDTPTGTHGRAETANEEGSAIRGTEDRVVTDEARLTTDETALTAIALTDGTNSTHGTVQFVGAGGLTVTVTPGANGQVTLTQGASSAVVATYSGSGSHSFNATTGAVT